MFLLGGTIGIPMVLSFPFSLVIKSIIIISLVLSFLAFSYGLKNSKKTHGQILTIIGFVVWSLIGTIGLGTAN